jgi:hypothetical protein
MAQENEYVHPKHQRISELSARRIFNQTDTPNSNTDYQVWYYQQFGEYAAPPVARNTYRQQQVFGGDMFSQTGEQENTV